MYCDNNSSTTTTSIMIRSGAFKYLRDDLHKRVTMASWFATNITEIESIQYQMIQVVREAAQKLHKVRDVNLYWYKSDSNTLWTVASSVMTTIHRIVTTTTTIINNIFSSSSISSCF